MEGQLEVSEQHVEILCVQNLNFHLFKRTISRRENLGASKHEDRLQSRSKTYDAQLSALEDEKQQITKHNHGKFQYSCSKTTLKSKITDERLRTKALNLRIHQLEQERNTLALRLEQYERDAASRELGESLTSTDVDDELLNDTKPTFNEQAAFMNKENTNVEQATATTDGQSETEVCKQTFCFFSTFCILQSSSFHASLQAQSSHSTLETATYVGDLERMRQQLQDACEFRARLEARCDEMDKRMLDSLVEVRCVAGYDLQHSKRRISLEIA